MTQEEWLVCGDPTPMLAHLLGPATVVTPPVNNSGWTLGTYPEKQTTDRKLRLFSVACCVRIWSLITDPRSQRAVEIGERYADGAVEKWEFDHARNEAGCVYRHGDFDGNFSAGEAALLPVDPDSATSAMDGATLAAEVVGNGNGPDEGEQAEQTKLLRDIFGNPFRPIAFDPAWRTSTAVALAQQMYESRDFSAMPILADALQDAGCEHNDILDHCRGDGTHVRGCWVVDLVLAKV